jgi:hypothetical protein
MGRGGTQLRFVNTSMRTKGPIGEPNQRPLRMALAVMPTAEQPARQPAAHRRS